MKLSRIVIDFAGEKARARAVFASTKPLPGPGRELVDADLGGIAGLTSLKVLVERAGDALHDEVNAAVTAALDRL